MRRGLRLVRVLLIILIAVAITGIASTPAAEADCSSGLWATATPSEGPAPLTVQFSASNGGVGCYSGGYYVNPYSWMGGDPDAYNLDLWSLEQNFTYTFTKAGTYEWKSRIFWPDEWGGCDQCFTQGTITVTDSEAPPSSKGGPADHPNTEFEGGDGPGECGGGMPNYWINTSSLNLFIEDTVFSYQGLGPGIRMTHSYNADPSQSGMFGKSWSFAYESSISQTCTEATLTKGSGATLKYTATLCSGENPATPPVEATPPEGQHDRLTWYGDYWLLGREGYLLYLSI